MPYYQVNKNICHALFFFVQWTQVEVALDLQSG